MRDYELVMVVKATETDEAVQALVAQLKDVATQRGAEVLEPQYWGRRKLAYEIKKEREGNYVLLPMKAEVGPITELERRLRINDTVLRFMAIRTDEDVKRARRQATIRARKKGVEVETLMQPPTKIHQFGVEEEPPIREESDDRDDDRRGRGRDRDRDMDDDGGED